jgi:hypothetical protein
VQSAGGRHGQWLVALVVGVIGFGVLWLLGSGGGGTRGADESPVVIPEITSLSATAWEPPLREFAPIDPLIVKTSAGTMEWTFDTEGFLVMGVPWGQGFVAEGRGQLWVSPDGARWEPVRPYPPFHDVVGMAVYDGEIYVVDSRTTMPEGYIIVYPSVWASSDLVEWRSVPVERVEPEDDWSIRAGIIASNTGVMLHDSSGRLWALSGQGFVVSRQAAHLLWAVQDGFITRVGDGPSVQYLFSRDGLQWEPIEVETTEGAALSVVGRGHVEYLGFAFTPGPAVLTSEDGIRWETSEGDTPAEVLMQVARSHQIVAVGSGWIAWSFSWGMDAFMSANGTRWEPLPGDLTRSWCGEPGLLGDRIVVAGCFHGPDGTWQGRFVED